MVRQAQADRPVVLVTTDPPATHVRHVTTDTPVERAQRATTVRFATTAVLAPHVMTAPRARIAPTAPPETNTHSAMVDLFVKVATLMRRASSTVRFVRLETNDATSVPRTMTVRFAMTVRLVTTVLPEAHAPRATTVRRARIVPTDRFAHLVMIDLHVTTVAHLATTADPAQIASRVTTGRHGMTVPRAATRTSTRRVTRRRFTSPETTSYSSVFRRWPPRPMTSMA
jgi:hypothetical protein